MRLSSLLAVASILFWGVGSVHAQPLHVEATAGVNWLDAPHSSFQIDPTRSVSLLVGYDVAAGHSLWLGAEYLSAEAFQPRQPGNESSIRIRTRSLPVQLGYRYAVLRSARFESFVHAGALVVPVRDEWTLDLPPESDVSTSVGANAEVGVRWHVLRNVSFVGKIGYQKTGGFGGRHVLAIKHDGVHVNVGMQLSR